MSLFSNAFYEMTGHTHTRTRHWPEIPGVATTPEREPHSKPVVGIVALAAGSFAVLQMNQPYQSNALDANGEQLVS